MFENWLAVHVSSLSVRNLAEVSLHSSLLSGTAAGPAVLKPLCSSSYN